MKTITTVLTEEKLNQKYTIWFKEQNNKLSVTYREFRKLYPEESKEWKDLLDAMFDNKVTIRRCE